MVSAKVIPTQPPEIKVVINNENQVIKGAVKNPYPSLVGHVRRVIDHAPEPYYEVANEYGMTIVIGD